MVSKFWGQHVLLDLNGCPREFLINKEHIKSWCKELIEGIDMIAYGYPIIEHFAAHNYDAGGFTLLQLIETSNICAHFAENIGQVYIDIFSCKAFDTSKAIDICKKYFEPTFLDVKEIERGSFKSLSSDLKEAC